jgi:hypothetical protein
MSFSSRLKSKSSQKFGKLLFYAMLIACKCTPFCKKLDCDTKNGPHDLTTTLTSQYLMPFNMLGLFTLRTHVHRD